MEQRIFLLNASAAPRMALMISEGAVTPLAVHLFGPFELQVNGTPMLRLRSRKGQWLLALLALRAGHEVERSWLAGTLWPDSPESAALANLRSSLKELRQALAPEAGRLCSPTPRTLCLDVPTAAVDVLAFDTLAHQKDPGALEQAVALYRGPLLEGCTEEWAFQERHAREQTYLDALENLAAQAQTAGDPGAAERYLRRAAAVDPLRETAQRTLMQALAAGGNYAAATQVYRELRLRLHRELNTAPDATTTALYEQLRAEARGKAGDRRQGSGVRGSEPGTLDRRNQNLPLPLNRFIGREQQITEVKQLLAAHRLVAVTGAGGCGKTRLALQVSTELLEEFPDGAWFVDLAPLADPALVPHTAAAALGLQEEPGRSIIETLVDFLRRRRLLLVLDNCEHLVEACARLAERLLQECPQVRILATSREALGIACELRYRVPSLALPPMVDGPAKSTAGRPSSDPFTINHPLSTLMSSEAVRLFVDRARMVLPTFAVTPENAPAVAQVCARLDGIPLAIELAAARVRVLPVEQINARLNDRFGLLTGGSRTALPRQQTLRALIDWSYELLTEPERILLRRLSVFAGGWTLEAAEAVCGEGCRVWGIGGRDDNDRPSLPPTPHALHPDQVLDVLSRLVDKSLVLYEEQHGEARYRLLETVRQYGQERLRAGGAEGRVPTEGGCWGPGPGGEAECVRDRHRDFFLALAEQAEPELIGADQAAWFDRLEREHDNLRTALDWSQTGERDLAKALRLAGALWWFWPMRNHSREGLTRLEALLAGTEEGLHFQFRAPVLLGAANLIWWQGDLKRAQPLYEQAQALFEKLGEKQGVARCLNDRGLLAQYQGDLAAARALQEHALVLQRELGNKQGIAWTTQFLGKLARAEGDLERARLHGEESLSRFREIGEIHGITTSLLHLGRMACDEGDMASARSLHEQSLTVGRELGNQELIVAALLELGYTARAQGAYEAAQSYYTQGLETGRQWNDIHSIAAPLSNLGRVAVGQGHLEAARSFLAEAIGLFQQRGDRWGIAEALEGLGYAAAQRQPERAARLMGAAEVIREEIRVPQRPFERAEQERAMATLHAALTDEALTAAWEEGRATSEEDAIADALEQSARRRGGLSRG